MVILSFEFGIFEWHLSSTSENVAKLCCTFWCAAANHLLLTAWTEDRSQRKPKHFLRNKQTLNLSEVRSVQLIDDQLIQFLKAVSALERLAFVC
jgi:hypothetical protein